jgi:hypothetical protein
MKAAGGLDSVVIDDRSKGGLLGTVDVGWREWSSGRAGVFART